MRIPRPIRWLLIVIALVFGWLAAGHLQATRAERQWQDLHRQDQHRQESQKHGHEHQPQPATSPVTDLPAAAER